VDVNVTLILVVLMYPTYPLGHYQIACCELKVDNIVDHADIRNISVFDVFPVTTISICKEQMPISISQFPP